MQSEVPAQSFVWGVLAPRFESELTLQKSEIWRLSGLLEEYGGVADNDFYREREQKTLIDELTGLLVHKERHDANLRWRSNWIGVDAIPALIRIHDLRPDLVAPNQRRVQQ
jgi:hypothetical protein